MKGKTRKVGRNAKDGKFVSAAKVLECPDTTLMDTVPVGKKMTAKKAIEEAIEGLDFQSETNFPVYLFSYKGIHANDRDVTCETMKSITGYTECEEKDFDKWFDKHSKPEVQPQAERYANLRQVMVEWLIQRKLFKLEVSPRRYAYYAIGIDRDCAMLGVVAESVET